MFSLLFSFPLLYADFVFIVSLLLFSYSYLLFTSKPVGSGTNTMIILAKSALLAVGSGNFGVAQGCPFCTSQNILYP